MNSNRPITFLFTDIERSSELWETHPQAMGRALAQHDSLMQTAFRSHNGEVFKTVGDAFCVAFTYPQDAVASAVAVQHALDAAAWEETGPLRVRIAIHSGAAELRDGDYFGPTLNRVARVLSVGHGGQTLLTHTVADSVRGSLPDHVSLRDLGERRLRDLRQPERIFQLLSDDLPDNFPPLRSLELLPNNLPAQVTSFVGRDREMAEVKRLIEASRLLTLTGPGGTGKTRLSLQAAAEVLDRFPHGVWLVELSTLSQEDEIPDAIINAVGIRGVAEKLALTTLLEALRTRQLLLVLDNCEHLVAAVARIVTTLLRGCPQLRVIASSREVLNVEGETLWALAPLSLPEVGRGAPLPPMDELERLEAVQLFVERATAVRPDFRLTMENAAQVAQICWRLDGLPLAIELAAARVKLLTLAQILERLDHRFRLLTGGSRAALPRQQTLGALIDWSYYLLSEPEQTLLRRLSVFVVGRTLEAAEAVCGVDGLDPMDIFDQLNSLADKSLLTVESGPGGETRFTMLESIWDYADDKLVEKGEAAKFRRRHLDYFVTFAETAEPHLTGPEQQAWLEKVAADHYNLNRAVQTSLESPETVELGLRIMGALCRYLEVRSYLTEGYALFQELFEKAGDSAAPTVCGKAHFGAGRLSWAQDRDEAARQHFLAAHDLYAAAGQKQEAALALAFLGNTERNDGRNAQAHEYFTAAFKAAEELGSTRVRLAALNGLGTLLSFEGDFAKSKEMKEECLAGFKAMGDDWPQAAVYGSLSRLYFNQRDFAKAFSYIKKALHIVRRLGNNWAVPYIIEGIGNICAEEGDAVKAVRLYGAGASHRAALALQFSKTEQVTYKMAMDRLHELLPEPQFLEEWTRGGALGFQASVDYAMEKSSPA